jgi:acyl-CoA synthetase (AMP-forming)/AMP-acid ligase II
VTVRRVLVTHRAGEGAKEGVAGWVKGRDVSLDAGEPTPRRGEGGGGEGCIHTTCLGRVCAEVASAKRGSTKPCTFTPAVMDAEDPLFILYTSGWVTYGGGGWWRALRLHSPRRVCRSTGTPKGVLHTTAG